MSKPGDLIRELRQQLSYSSACIDHAWSCLCSNCELCRRALALADAVDRLVAVLPKASFFRCPRDTNNGGDCGK